jgi:hypothetical protein
MTYPIPLLTKLSLLVPLGRRVNVIGTSVMENPFFFALMSSSAVISKFFETRSPLMLSIAFVE